MREHAEQDIRLAIRRKSIRVPLSAVALDIGYRGRDVMIRRALTSAINRKEIEAAAHHAVARLRCSGIGGEANIRTPVATLPALPLRAAVIGNIETS